MNPEIQISDKKEEKEENYVDEEGFVRKPRRDLGLILWFVAGFIGNLSLRFSILSGYYDIIFWPILAYFAYMGIKMYSSHNIDTWKNSKHANLWIYLGCLVAGIVGIIVYYYLKRKERIYLKLHKNIDFGART